MLLTALMGAAECYRFMCSQFMVSPESNAQHTMPALPADTLPRSRCYVVPLPGRGSEDDDPC